MQSIKTAQMVREIMHKFPIGKDVQDALLKINRELFVPEGFVHLAYSLDALPMGASQWISSPLTVAKMTEYLQCNGADSVLEIGCGSGYQAAILSCLIRRVFSIERIEKLLNEARIRIKSCNLTSICCSRSEPSCRPLISMPSSQQLMRGKPPLGNMRKELSRSFTLLMALSVGKASLAASKRIRSQSVNSALP